MWLAVKRTINVSDLRLYGVKFYRFKTTVLKILCKSANIKVVQHNFRSLLAD